MSIIKIQVINTKDLKKDGEIKKGKYSTRSITFVLREGESLTEQDYKSCVSLIKEVADTFTSPYMFTQIEAFNSKTKETFYIRQTTIIDTKDGPHDFMVSPVKLLEALNS